MINKKSLFSFIILDVLISGQSAIAGGDAISTMASIMMNLNHYPSDSEKQTLNGIANNSAASEHERIMAQAMINLQHKASDADMPKLKKIMNDDSASADAKDLAGIILNLNHKPSGSDKARLKKMMH